MNNKPSVLFPASDQNCLEAANRAHNCLGRKCCAGHPEIAQHLYRLKARLHYSIHVLRREGCLNKFPARRGPETNVRGGKPQGQMQPQKFTHSSTEGPAAASCLFGRGRRYLPPSAAREIDGIHFSSCRDPYGEQCSAPAPSGGAPRFPDARRIWTQASVSARMVQNLREEVWKTQRDQLREITTRQRS